MNFKRITDPGFHYVPAAQTDIRKTFARLRREARERDRQQAPTRGNVKQFARGNK